MHIPTPSTFNNSNRLAKIDEAYNMWIDASEQGRDALGNYFGENLGILLVEFSRTNPPETLLPSEYNYFMGIMYALCIAGGMSDEEIHTDQ